MNVWVVILNWNGKNDTLACLHSLAACQNATFQTLVVDNGSSDDSVSEIRKHYPFVRLVETGENLGYAGGNNIGIQEALREGAEAILLLNNDTVVNPNFIEAFVKSARQDPSVGIWGGYPLRFYDPERLDHLGGKWNPELADFELVGLNEPKGFQTDLPLDYVCGCSIFIRREVFEEIGLLESKFFLFWEEADFAMRAKRAGFSVKVCSEAVLLHKVSASFIGGSPHKKYFWWRGRFLWIERNCSLEEKQKIFQDLITRELWHYKKLYWIKRAQLGLLRFLRRKDLKQKEEKIHQYRAVLQGLRDYKKGIFGPGPSWLFRGR